ncbi:MAG: hypothetical protein JO251_12635, partial [Verrucomicrobia bacterium]|nr:hypothetical protein [Verrucomicrobiota bacterium]
RDLALAHNCVGNILEAQGESSGAANEYEQAHKIAKALVALDPTNILWKQDLIDFKRQIERVR